MELEKIRKVRRTSIEAFKIIKENKMHGRRQQQVYEILCEHGPLTGNELANIFKDEHGATAPNQANLVTRLGELRDRGSVAEIRERVCTVTKRVVIEWGVTGDLPKNFKKPKKTRCQHCNGKGYIKDKQLRMF